MPAITRTGGVQEFKPVVLLIDDSPGAIRLMAEAFLAAKNCVELHKAADGLEAIAFLRRRGPYADCPRPNLILLDIYLRKMNGFEVLAEIKKDDGLKTIPTLMLTMSSAEDDVATSYRLGANCFLRKPLKFEEFELLVKDVGDFWLSKASLTNLIPPAR